MKPSKGVIAIAGAGRMGRGIALTFAYQGYQVKLLDIKNRDTEEFQQLKTTVFHEIKNQLDVLVLGDVILRDSIPAILDRIEVSSIHTDNEASWKESEILFEAVPEALEIKEEVFKCICPHLSPTAMIASTTSSFSANELAEFVTTKARFMNTHWLNPAYLIPLVEVSPSNETSKESLQEMFSLLESIGKVPVECKPSPGFIVPRIQALAMNEASRLVEEGVASVEDIDKASKVGFGIRFAVLGLLEFIDWGGADTLFHASNYLQHSMEDDRFETPEIIKKKMADGEIGMKARKGFYSFDETTINDYQIQTLQKFIDLMKHLGLMEDNQFHKGMTGFKEADRIQN
ncbi:3-hydroxybutyryl-CoA dehydrogenase [Alkalihalobacillus sp. TS-13]|uniref:3-hydroxybutyryl-CoA dehydrogenase n=1 Tax=Alkalihalobacillus sp. TS-13 TaxID=2842455 RepID=UPI001C880794|nr:3-hydroxybutyryl-CoA dehydrogenase [Alkalihalobacillus sp. TS-13]